MALSGLIVDWGGVLTVGMHEAMTSWADEEAIDIDAFVATMRDWLGRDYALGAAYNPIHALERGELEVPCFERHLADALTQRTGRAVVAEGLLDRMFAFFAHSPDMVALVRRARARGIRTALLSNSWGNTYPRDLFDGVFDAVVISGEVGMRKPDPEIYLHTLDRLGLDAVQCVFVDDLPPNVQAARDLGMVAVLHSGYEQTAAELDVLFGQSLSR
jgi:epoxide hydrolase-like predicted phosphatase